MPEALLLLVLAASCGGIVYTWRQLRLRDIARGRMTGAPAAAQIVIERRILPFARRHYFAPWLVGLVLAGLLHWLLHLDWNFALAFGLIGSLLGGMADAMWLSRREAKIEQQLADAIDLMVGALHAGASVPTALESALQEGRVPLRPQLEEMLGRLRLGDEAPAAFQGLAARVPLDNFRLFASALTVHWEVGGSLAPTLATVGRTIRDRIEVARRIHSMTSQSRFSIVAILGATYFIALLMWRNDPERMGEFLTNIVGQRLAAGAVVLQAIGIVWAAQVGKLKF